MTKPMNQDLSTHYQNSEWMFNGRSIKLKNLSYDQLNEIRNTLNNCRTNIIYDGNRAILSTSYYNGKSVEYWKKALKNVEKINDFNTFKELVRVYKNTKINKSIEYSNKVINQFQNLKEYV